VTNLKELLDLEYAKRNQCGELCETSRPDPLIVAKRHNDEFIALACALFAYGKASLILKFLNTINFGLLEGSDEELSKSLSSSYYRFQTASDTVEFFKALSSLKRSKISLEELFFEGYRVDFDPTRGVSRIIKELKPSTAPKSQGYEFLIGSGEVKPNGSPMKRWMMFLRWMVRKDELDMGLWKKVDKAHLILPLDTHTFNVSKRVGLLESGSYNLRSAIKITEKLREFDKEDPIKYDFALYRLGQEKLA
jgi:uncharacterized protein (TIGR02757 family)